MVTLVDSVEKKMHVLKHLFRLIILYYTFIKTKLVQTFTFQTFLSKVLEHPKHLSPAFLIHSDEFL